MEALSLSVLVEDVRLGKYDGTPAYVVNQYNNKIVLVKAGENGYYPLKEDVLVVGTLQDTANKLNAEMGVEALLAEAIHIVSMFPNKEK